MFKLRTVVFHNGKRMHSFEASVPDVDEAKVRLIDAQMAYLTNKWFHVKFDHQANGGFLCTCTGQSTELSFSADYVPDAEYNKQTDAEIERQLEKKSRHAQMYGTGKLEAEALAREQEQFNPVLSVTSVVTK